jgi:hypothetical protein
MKKLLTILLIGATWCVGTVSAQNHEENRDGRFSLPWGHGHDLQSHINHLNRMVGHVRWQLTRYHPNRAMRSDFEEIRRDVDHVNGQFRNGRYDRGQLRREIDNLHDRLHRLEVRMRVRSSDYYIWR